MGKGDKKSKRGKIFKGSFGVRRPHHVKNNGSASAVSKPVSAENQEAPKKKVAAAAKKKTEKK